MGNKAEGTASGNGGEEEWERGSNVRIRTIIRRWWGRSQKGSAGPGGGGEDNDWGYDQVPNEDRSDIDKQGIGSGNGPGGGKSGKLGDSVGELKEEEPARYLQSTKIRLVEEYVPRQIPGGKTKLRC